MFWGNSSGSNGVLFEKTTVLLNESLNPPTEGGRIVAIMKEEDRYN